MLKFPAGGVACSTDITELQIAAVQRLQNALGYECFHFAILLQCPTRTNSSRLRSSYALTQILGRLCSHIFCQTFPQFSKKHFTERPSQFGSSFCLRKLSALRRRSLSDENPSPGDPKEFWWRHTSMLGSEGQVYWVYWVYSWFFFDVQRDIFEVAGMLKKKGYEELSKIGRHDAILLVFESSFKKHDRWRCLWQSLTGLKLRAFCWSLQLEAYCPVKVRSREGGQMVCHSQGDQTAFETGRKVFWGLSWFFGRCKMVDISKASVKEHSLFWMFSHIKSLPWPNNLWNFDLKNIEKQIESTYSTKITHLFQRGFSPQFFDISRAFFSRNNARL